MNNQEFVAIKDLKIGMKNINVVVIVLEIGPVTLTKEGREVRSVRVADASAAVNLSVWDQAGALLVPGDIVRVTRGYAQPWRNALTLYTGKQGDLQKVGEFCMLFNEQLNMSEPVAAPPAAPTAPAPPAAPTTTTTAAPPAAAAGNKHKTYARPRHPQPRSNNRR